MMLRVLGFEFPPDWIGDGLIDFHMKRAYISYDRCKFFCKVVQSCTLILHYVVIDFSF